MYPKAARAVRDLWRQRAPWVRQHTAKVLSGHNIMVRHTGARLRVKRIRELPKQAREGWLPEADQVLAITSSLAILDCLSQQSKALEQIVPPRLHHPPAYEQRLTVHGIGTIFAQTITLDTGDIHRFPTVGNSASSCRCVDRNTISHGKRTGPGQVKNGTPYVGWASMEAAQFALRFHPSAPRFDQRKLAKSNNKTTVARQAVAHTLSRACSDVMRDLVPFEATQACGCGRLRTGLRLEAGGQVG